jgi:octaprenyl-diphosphate synthase
LGEEALSAAAFASQLETHVRPEFLGRLAEDIRLVEEELERRLSSEVKLVEDAAKHTLHAGGKRLRPALVTLSAEATGLPFDPDRTRRLGACMEMIHMATLMHDDVIDRAGTRRGTETSAAKFGSTASILTGDVLLSKAMAILAEDGDLEIIRNVSRAVVDLAEGEVHELESRGKADISKAEHFRILEQKTATFIASCCQVGALAASASLSVVEALGRYGRSMGMAFQIADDLLDYAADCEATGKPKWTDFGEGCATLPLILLWPELSASERSEFELAFGNAPDSATATRLQNLMRSKGSFERAEAVACEYVAEALKSLEALPESPARVLLATVANFVVWRKS